MRYGVAIAHSKLWQASVTVLCVFTPAACCGTMQVELKDTDRRWSSSFRKFYPSDMAHLIEIAMELRGNWAVWASRVGGVSRSLWLTGIRFSKSCAYVNDLDAIKTIWMESFHLIIVRHQSNLSRRQKCQ